MLYVPLMYEKQARRAVDFEGCGNIAASGSVTGMQNQFGWYKGGQVRLGGYIYNVGPQAVQVLKGLGYVRGYREK